MPDRDGSEDPADLGAVEDDIGEEHDDDDDEVYNEQRPATGNDAGKKSRQRRPLPTWLAGIFKTRVAEAGE